MKNLDKRLEKLLDKYTIVEKEPLWRLGILQYQIGDIQRWAIYEKYYGEKNPIKNHLSGFLSDALIQMFLLIKSLGFDVEELTERGIQKIVEKEYDKKIRT